MKRLFDTIAAAVTLLLLCLPLAGLTLLVRRKLGRPAFFRQVRTSLHGQPFEMVKFRSMTDARGPTGAVLPDADRLTRPLANFCVPAAWTSCRGCGACLKAT